MRDTDSPPDARPSVGNARRYARFRSTDRGPRVHRAGRDACAPWCADRRLASAGRLCVVWEEQRKGSDRLCVGHVAAPDHAFDLGSCEPCRAHALLLDVSLRLIRPPGGRCPRGPTSMGCRTPVYCRESPPRRFCPNRRGHTRQATHTHRLPEVLADAITVQRRPARRVAGVRAIARPLLRLRKFRWHRRRPTGHHGRHVQRTTADA
jgi:hypothetical protein